jgi:hypothetical protein
VGLQGNRIKENTMEKILIFIGLWLVIAAYVGWKVGKFIYMSDYKALSHSPQNRPVAPLHRAVPKTK